MIARPSHIKRIRELFLISPAVAILGARQTGKTTLANLYAQEAKTPVVRFDLEDPADRGRLEDPVLALGNREGLVIIDEVQRAPQLFEPLRVILDRTDNRCLFLILGSASPELLQQSSETLAGRILYHELNGLSVPEVGGDARERLWLRGGFPRSFLAPSDELSDEWRRGFIRTFLERDLPQLGSRVPSTTLHRFWTMLAHYHAQTWNGAELARAFAVTAPTVRRYLDTLTASLVLRQLHPWHSNVGKRQVRSPKIYLADTGMLHTLLGISDTNELEGHPKVGASWEGFVMQEIVQRTRARPDECFFWATHSGAEIDLLLVRGTRRIGFEIKRTTAPRTTRSLHIARETLELDETYLVHAGDQTYPLKNNTIALAFERLHHDLPPIR